MEVGRIQNASNDQKYGRQISFNDGTQIRTSSFIGGRAVAVFFLFVEQNDVAPMKGYKYPVRLFDNSYNTSSSADGRILMPRSQCSVLDLTFGGEVTVDNVGALSIYNFTKEPRSRSGHHRKVQLSAAEEDRSHFRYSTSMPTCRGNSPSRRTKRCAYYCLELRGVAEPTILRHVPIYYSPELQSL